MNKIKAKFYPGPQADCRRRHRRFSTMVIRLVMFVFAILFLTLLCVTFLFLFLTVAGIRPFVGHSVSMAAIFIIAIFSIIIGTFLSLGLSRFPLRPLRKMMDAFNELARGHFETRLDYQGIEELEDLADSFNKMAAELGSLEILRHDFISNVSHEFKTPLAVIQGYAKLLEEDSLSPEERLEYAAIIQTETERLKELTSNILKISKLNNQSIVEEPEYFALDEQLRQVIVSLEQKWLAKGLSLTIDLDDIEYLGYQDLLFQVWYNLLDNAIKFSPEGARIAVRLIETPSGPQVEFADEGIGMDAEMQEHIFDQFYQGESSHASSGNGLGLTLVSKIVAIHHGDILVDSSPHGGSIFIISLPANTGHRAEKGAVSNP